MKYYYPYPANDGKHKYFIMTKSGKHIYFGTSSSIKQGLSICNNVTVGMGAVIVNNINESGIYVGIPASKKN